MNRINIDDEVKIVNESYSHGKIVKVNSIQKLADNSILYTGIYEDKHYKLKGLVQFIQFKEGDYEIINHQNNDYSYEKKNLTLVIKIDDLNKAGEVLDSVKEEIEKVLNEKI